MNLRIGRREFNCLTAMMLALLLSFACSKTARAQAAQAELVGAVTDAAGAGVPSARVSLTELATGRTRETTTDGSGSFVFTNQRPGVYKVNFRATGFTVLVRENITLTTGERVRLDETLAVAGLQTVV